MKGEPIQKASSVLPKVSNLRGITEIKSYFRFWANLNVKLSTGIFLNCGNFLKLFDPQALSSPIPRDLSSPKIHNNSSLLKFLFFATIPIILYRLNTRALIEVENRDLARLVNDSVKINSVERTILVDSNIDPFYSSKRVLPLSDTMNSPVPEWWKDWIIRDILPSWGIPEVLINKVTMLLRTKNTENLNNFFEFYIYGLPNGEWDSWRYNFDLFFVRDEKQNLDMSHNLKRRKNLLGNHLLCSAMVGFCEKLLLEAEDPSYKKNYESDICLIERYPSRFRIHPQRYLHTDPSYQNLTDYTEYLTDSLVKREYREIGGNLIRDFVEFYNWVYQFKNNRIRRGYEDDFYILRCLAGQRFVPSGRVASSKHSLSLISDILYNFSIFTLSRIVESKSSKRLYTERMEDISYRTSSGGIYGEDKNLAVTEGGKNFYLSRNHITSSTKGSDRSSDYYIESNLKEWDWIKFIILIRLPASAKYENSGFFLSPISSPFIADGLESLGEADIAESTAGTGFIIDKDISESHSLELPKISESYNYTDFAKSPMDERLLFGKTKSQPLNKQHFVLSEDSKSSGINRIVDLYRIKSSSCSSPKYDELVRYDSSSMKELIENILFLHKPIISFPSINPLLSSKFREFITKVTNKIDSFITLPDPTPGTILLHSIPETNPDISLESDRALLHGSETKNLKYSDKYILMDPAEDSPLIDKAKVRDINKKIFLLLNWYDLFNPWNDPEGDTNISWISRSIYFCKNNKLVYTYSAHIRDVYENLNLIPLEHFTGLKELINIWINNRNHYYLSKCAIQQDFFIRQRRLVNKLGEFTRQTDRFCSNMRGIINRIQYFKLFIRSLPYQIVGIEKICGFNEPVTDKLLRNIVLGRHNFLGYPVTGKVLDGILKMFESLSSDLVRPMNCSLSSREFSYSNRKLLEYSKYRLDEEVIASGYSTIPTNRITFNFLHEENIPVKSLYNSIYAGMANWTDRFNHLNVQKNIPLKHYFNEANKLLFLDSFNNLLFDYDKRIFLCGRTFIKGYNRVYMDFISTDAFKGSKKFLLFARKEPLSIVESKISRIDSQLYSRELLEYKYPVPFEKKDLLYRAHFAKRFISLIWVESYHLEKPSMFPLQMISLNRSPIIRQLVNFGIYDYWRPLMEFNHGEFLTITNGSSKNKFYEKEPRDNTINTQLDWNDSDNTQLLGLDGYRNSNKGLCNNITGIDIYRRSLPIDSNKPRLKIFLCKEIGLDICSKKWLLVKRYILWFFTPEWWRYVENYFSETFPEKLLNAVDRLGYNVFDSSSNIESSLIIQWLNLGDKLKIYPFNSPILDSDNLFSEETTGQEKSLLSRWLLVGPFTGHSIPYLVLVTLIPFLYAVSQQYLATFMGFNSISLWKRSEIIKYLKNYPWKIAMEKSTKDSPSSVRQNSARISLMNLSKRFLKQLTRLNLSDPLRREINIWLSRKKNVDISREEKSLVVQYLVTNTTLYRYGFQLNYDSDPLRDSINRSIGKKGFTHLQFIVKACRRYCFAHPNRRLDLLENTVLSALQQNLNSTRISGRFNILLNTPISLQSGSFSGKGILLIGPTETGRSYLVKNLAANYRFPLVRIPIQRFLFNKPDFRNTPVVLLSKKCLHRLNLTFELIKKMSPCIVWIQDIHELNFNYTINELGVNPRSLLHSLLGHLSSRSINNCLENNIIFAPTHVPARVDPAFISPDRLDQLINIRAFNTHKRGKEFIALLHTRGFNLEIDPARYKDFGSRTMGYSRWDLAVLANETSLIGITQEKLSLGPDTIESAFYRQGWTIDNKSRSVMGYEILLYRIGRAIVRNIFTKNPCMDFPLTNNHLLRKRFYFISDWYLEPPIVESTMKESIMLPHILGCIAGLAARDSWFAWGNEQEDSVPIARIAENDFQLACGILESLLEEFPRLNLCEDEPDTSAPLSLGIGIFRTIVKNSREFSGNRGILNRSIGDNAFSSDANGFFGEVPQNLYRAPRVWRISFLRGSTYEFVRVPSEPAPPYNSITSHWNQNRLTQSHSVSAKVGCDRDGGSEIRESFVGYRRLLMDVREKHLRIPGNQLKDTPLHEFFVESGTDESSIQYKMQYNSSNQSKLFLGGRFVWNPASPLLPETYYPSLRDELFSGEQTVRRLYITHSTRGGRQKYSPIDRYKKHFLRHDSNRDYIIESFTDSWKEIPRVERQYFEYIKINQMMKSHLLTPQLFPIAYPYQVLFLEETQNIYDHFSFSDQRHRRIKANQSSTIDSIIYTTLFESYQYLLNLFSFNRKALCRILSTLPKNGFILSSEIEEIFSG
uniref:Ycf2 n=1 Tax=Ophioglossum hongii TaxID=3238578 RepID=A0AB39U2Z2_9MONI